MIAAWYYLAVTILLLLCALAWCLNLLSLPGNWLMLILAGAFAWLFSSEAGQGIGWPTVAILAGLCVVGELIESFAGAAGAAKLGGSRRGMILSVLGAVAGSLLGTIVGSPIPVVGSVIAAVVGGGAGAFAGALVGEHWKGKQLGQGMKVGRAAFLGRIWGTIGKLAVGATMFAVTAVDALR